MVVSYSNFYANYENNLFMTNDYRARGQKSENYRSFLRYFSYFAFVGLQHVLLFFFAYFSLHFQNCMRYITFNSIFAICTKIQIGNFLHKIKFFIFRRYGNFEIFRTLWTRLKKFFFQSEKIY